MKERITYILAEGEEGVNPANVQVNANSVKSPGFKAAKEWRITLSTHELPQTLQHVLKSAHELHVRWTSLDHTSAPAPFSSRTPPGLHAFYTPIQDGEIEDTTQSPDLCNEIKNAFGPQLRCDSTSAAFSRQDVLSKRFAMSSAYQYYQQLPLLSHLQDYLRTNYCPASSNQAICMQRIETLQQASSLDFDFDAISQSVVVTATWPPAYHRSTDGKRSPEDRVEVGILNQEKATESEEISLGGFLTVVGEDDEPKATLFSFPSRHHQLPLSGAGSLSFTSSFKEPTGLHPTLQLQFDKSTVEPPNPFCALHAYFTLPSTLFIDRYQFSDALFLDSQHLVALRSISGETDLEAPDWVVDKWGSAALFELATPDDRPRQSIDQWTVSIPLHLRYLPPRSSNNASGVYPDHLVAANADIHTEQGKRTTSVPYPAVFWACPADSGLKMAVNPFDRVNLGYDGLFGPKTLFWHARPAAAPGHGTAPGRLDAKLDVPVLDMARTQNVEMITGLAVLVGFAWVCWKLLQGAMRQGGDKSVKSKKDQ